MKMDAFQKKFIEEATDHIADLEEALLILEQQPNEKTTIERVFRAMHSLKGGGAMFGFNMISEITHHIETIYDMIRNNQVELSEEILNTTFDVVDHLKKMIEEPNNTSDEINNRQKQLLDVIEKLTDNKKEVENINTSDDSDSNNEKTYYISFKPEKNILNNGTNPIFLIDEMAEMGNIYTIARMNEVPDFDKITPTLCYISWDIILSTNQSIDNIRDVFIFVQEDSQIEIQPICDGNLLNNEPFNQFLDEMKKEKGLIDKKKLNAFIQKQNEIAKKAAEASSDKNTQQKTIAQNKKNQISSIRVDSEKIDSLMNLVSELVTTQARLTLFTEKDENSELLQISENVQKLTRDLRDLSFSIALIPIDHVIINFQRLVRDLSKELNKKVDFITEGTDTELDKNIIESLNDPILHILRNCLDHGIEDPETRKKMGKPEKGKILFKAFYSGASVYIKIHNDGAAMDKDKIKQKAIDKKIIDPEAVLSDKEILNLVFEPGFSTSDNVTDVSGRGVGMDVVKRKVSEIRGEVDIDSQPGEGTTVTIKLPLTLSIIDGLLVSIDKTHYIIPLMAVNKIYGIAHEDIKENFNNVVVLDGEQIPYLYLRNEFGIGLNGLKNEQAVVVNYDEKKVALIVDNVVGEYQAVLKTLGKHYSDQDMVSGATILGDGSVALVMDTNKMIMNCVNKNK